MRFRSGTLERSVRRWGRFPRSGARLAKQRRGWNYIQLDDSGVDRTTPDTEFVVLGDANDWADGSGGGANGRNVRYDIQCGLTWTPNLTALEFDSWGWYCGIFTLEDENTETDGLDLFDKNWAHSWYAVFRNTVEGSASAAPMDTTRQASWRMRGRIRSIPFGERLTFAGRFHGNVTGTLGDARLWMFGIVSWDL